MNEEDWDYEIEIEIETAYEQWLVETMMKRKWGALSLSYLSVNDDL